jgi:hypothetical protein
LLETDGNAFNTLVEFPTVVFVLQTVAGAVYYSKALLNALKSLYMKLENDGCFSYKFN